MKYCLVRANWNSILLNLSKWLQSDSFLSQWYFVERRWEERYNTNTKWKCRMGLDWIHLFLPKGKRAARLEDFTKRRILPGAAQTIFERYMNSRQGLKDWLMVIGETYYKSSSSKGINHERLSFLSGHMQTSALVQTQFKKRTATGVWRSPVM